MARIPKIKSDFAVLDVKAGRAALHRLLEPEGIRIPITITGFITHTWGPDDGISREFEVEVTNVETR